MVVEIKNLTKCIGKLNKLSDTDLTEFFMQTGIRLRDTIKDVTPVGTTGNLKANISDKPINTVRYGYSYRNGVIVYSPTEYAIYQELGTTKMFPTNGGKGFFRYGFEIFEQGGKVEKRLSDFYNKRIKTL